MSWAFDFSQSDLKLAVALEREACAVLVEGLADTFKDANLPGSLLIGDLAAAIRARSEVTP